MHRPFIDHIHPASKLLFVALLIVASSIVVMALATFLGFLFFNPSDMIGAFKGSLENIAVLKYLQIAQSIALFIIPAWLSAIFFSKNTGQYLHFTKRNLTPLTILLVSAIMLSAIPLIDFTGYINQKLTLPEFMKGIEEWMFRMEEAGKVVIEKFANVHTASGLMINIIMIGVLPALGEEMLFRGTIQPLLKTWFKNNHAAVWVTAFIFSAMHFQFYGFIPRMLLGAVMGYMLVWSGTLWLPILAHFVNNTTGVILYFLYYNNVIKIDPDQLGYANEILPLVLSTLFMLIILYLLRKQLKTTKNKHHTGATLNSV